MLIGAKETFPLIINVLLIIFWELWSFSPQNSMMNVKLKKEQHLFGTETFCDIIKVRSLLIHLMHPYWIGFFKRKSYWP